MLKPILPLVVAALVSLLATPVPAGAQEFVVDGTHSSVTFKIRHLLTKVSGLYREFAGKIVYDADEPTASSVNFTIEADSIDTRNEKRDEHLRSPDFFDVANHPQLTFNSIKVEAKGSDRLLVTGELSIRGVTKPITVPVEVLGVMKTPRALKAGFQTSFTINRKDFGVSWNRMLDQGGVVLGDEVTIEIDIEADGKLPDEAGAGE
ncbi:MAG: YceI family protein [Acidobacteriota bacterium]|nr:MAG: YceI family protein [Acidobacteriota bacterium]